MNCCELRPSFLTNLVAAYYVFGIEFTLGMLVMSINNPLMSSFKAPNVLHVFKNMKLTLRKLTLASENMDICIASSIKCYSYVHISIPFKSPIIVIPFKWLVMCFVCWGPSQPGPNPPSLTSSPPSAPHVESNSNGPNKCQNLSSL